MRSCKLLLLFHSFLLHSVATVFRIANWDLILLVLYMRLNVIFNIRKIATLPRGGGPKCYLRNCQRNANAPPLIIQQLLYAGA